MCDKAEEAGRCTSCAPTGDQDGDIIILYLCTQHPIPRFPGAASIFRKIADRLNLDTREYDKDDTSRAVDCPDAMHNASSSGYGPSQALDRGPPS
jgi:hypothetical protein